LDPLTWFSILDLCACASALALNGSFPWQVTPVAPEKCNKFILPNLLFKNMFFEKSLPLFLGWLPPVTLLLGSAQKMSPTQFKTPHNLNHLNYDQDNADLRAYFFKILPPKSAFALCKLAREECNCEEEAEKKVNIKRGIVAK
jgi:hypothetical protein